MIYVRFFSVRMSAKLNRHNQFKKMSNSDDELPYSILEVANSASINLLPIKSKEKYNKQYDDFQNWCHNKGTNSTKEEVFLAYFAHLSKIFQPNTLWSKYSMLKSVLKIKINLDLSQYYKLTSFLKKQNVGYRPKKSKIFDKNDISKFMKEAPDETYLLIKVATIFGLAGACRRDELCKIMIDDIEDKGNLIAVKIPDSKNHTQRLFVISNEINGGHYLQLFHKYSNLRRPNTTHGRFFVQYRRGICTTQCVGINSFGKMPSEIAAYLKLKDPTQYTGHSFRRSSATILADSGAGIINVKRLGGWKSTTVAESYIDDSTNHKKKMSNNILGTNNSPIALSKTSLSHMYSCPNELNQASSSSDVNYSSALSHGSLSQNLNHPVNELTGSAINLQNVNNCSFVININNK